MGGGGPRFALLIIYVLTLYVLVATFAGTRQTRTFSAWGDWGSDLLEVLPTVVQNGTLTSDTCVIGRSVTLLMEPRPSSTRSEGGEGGSGQQKKHL